MQTRLRSIWKRVLLGVGGVVIALGLVLVVGALLIDPTVDLGVEKQLASPPPALWRHLDNTAGLDRWWSAAQEGGGQPRMVVTHKGGSENSAGLAVTFQTGDQVMETWVIKALEPQSRIVYDVDFAGMMSVERTLVIAPDGEGSRVSWRERGSIDHLVFRWMKVFMGPDAAIKNFEMALAALDKAARR